MRSERFGTVLPACRRSYLSAHGRALEKTPFQGSLLLTGFRILIAAGLTMLAVSAAAPTAHAEPRRQMVRTINYVRSWSHRHGLAFSGRVSRGATEWARHLMLRNVLVHSGQAISRGEGEVIEWHTGARANINKTVMEWWHSTGHRHVMLSGRYHRAGAGRAVGYWGGRKCTVWVARFAR